MRLLVVNNLYEPFAIGGAEKVTKLLAEGMVSRGHEVRILTTLPEGSERFEDRSGVQVRYLPVRNLYRPFARSHRTTLVKLAWHGLDSFNPLMGRAVAQDLAAWRPDILHTHNLTGFSTATWSVAHAQRIPIVHTLHDYYLLCPRSSMYRDGRRCATDNRCLECRLYAWPRIRTTRYLSAAVGVSRFILDRHLVLGCFLQAPHKMVIHNPIANGRQLTRNTGLRNGEGVLKIGYLGRLAPSKGIESLLAAWRVLPAGMAELWIAGTGEADYLSRLRCSDEPPGLHWLGYCDPEALFSKIHTLIIPSDWEDPAPLVVIEAMKHGIPVLGAARGGIPELLGEGGWIYDGTPDDLANRIRWLSANPGEIRHRADMAYQRAEAFSIATALDAYEHLYQQILATPND